jgi:DNA-binding response OmpR family regulator
MLEVTLRRAIMRVLVIDTDWCFVRQARQYLEAHAHLVVHQNQPRDAQAQAEHWQPDLVILSAELADDELIRSLQETPDRPAILLTDHMDSYDRAWRTWQKCGDELLMKPVFRAAELHEAIVSALQNAAAGVSRPAALAVSA